MIRASSIGQRGGGLLDPFDDLDERQLQLARRERGSRPCPADAGLLGGHHVRANRDDPPLPVGERRGGHELAAEHAHLDGRTAVPRRDRGRVDEHRSLEQRGEGSRDVATIRTGAGEDRGGRFGGENRRCPLRRDLCPRVASDARLGDRDDARHVARELLRGCLRIRGDDDPGRVAARRLGERPRERRDLASSSSRASRRRSSRRRPRSRPSAGHQMSRREASRSAIAFAPSSACRARPASRHAPAASPCR